tara:strand:- start:180 stop:356 length:177 start_codon:yes stop_codon:yes gene_type:complete
MNITDDIDYGGWLDEDLRDLYKDLMDRRNKSEDYSDRVALNQEGLRVLAELQRRKSNG